MPRERRVRGTKGYAESLEDRGIVILVNRHDDVELPYQACSEWRPDAHRNGGVRRNPLTLFKEPRGESCPEMPSHRHIRSSERNVFMYADYRRYPQPTRDDGLFAPMLSKLRTQNSSFQGCGA